MIIEQPGILEMQQDVVEQLLQPEVLLPPPPFAGPPGTQGWSTEEFGNQVKLVHFTMCCMFLILERNMQNIAMGQGTPLIPQGMNDKELPSLLSLKVAPPDQMIEGSNNAEVVLPQVIEQVLALKNQRAMELGVDDANAENLASRTADGDKENAGRLWDKDENVSISSSVK